MSAVANTIAMLKARRAYRAAGGDVAYMTDPAWLVTMAINRRAGWRDAPGHWRGSARPLPDGSYPPHASGERWRAVRFIANHLGFGQGRTQIRLADLRAGLTRAQRRRINPRRIECECPGGWDDGTTVARCEVCLVAWWMDRGAA